MAEILAILDKVEALITSADDHGNLDLAVALLRLAREIKRVRVELEADFDRHIEEQAAFWLLRQEAALDATEE